MLAKYLLAWILLAVVAIANGVLRQTTYGRIMPELAAHQVSTLTAIIATGAVVWWLNQVWPIDSSRQAWTIGLAWLLATIIFEFGFGLYVAGHSWSRLLGDYDIVRGRVWIIFLLWLTTIPYAVFRLGKSAN
jgi:hypothetical protein